MEMKVYDCNLSYGRYVSGGPYRPCGSIGELGAELDRAGIAGGLIYHVATDGCGVVTGHNLLSEDLKTAKQELWGVWSLLPSCTQEIPLAVDLPAAMKANGIGAVRLNPAGHKYLPLPRVLGDYLEMLQERRIPVHFDTGCGITLEQVDSYLSAFPRLTAILTHADCWPCDRLLRPFLEQYENLCLDTSYLLTDQSFEELVLRYGAARLLFGSGFPTGYLGAHMLTLRHSQITEQQKAAILGGNLVCMIKGAELG